MKIAYFILNSFNFDSRARLEVETLKQQKHQVEIIATIGADSHTFLGCPIHRIPQWPGPTKKFRFIQYNYLASRLARKLKPDICHAVDLDTLQAAAWAAESLKAKLVYESRELYTELEALSGRPRIREIWRKLESRLIGKADRVITINDSIANELTARYGIKKPDIVRNVAAIPKSLSPIDLRAKFDIPQNHSILIYQGVLRRGQGLVTALEIFSRLPRNFSLVIVGTGQLESELKDKAKSHEMANRVKFAGQVASSDMLNYTVSADAGLLLMEDVALNNHLALPQKLFQYLSAGIPQIVSPLPEIAGFVRSNKTGLIIDPSNLDDAANSIKSLLTDSAGLDALKKHCSEVAALNNWELESQILIDLYRCLGK
jgi:glycosyltransferase involved in cell wall biosynthesis